MESNTPFDHKYDIKVVEENKENILPLAKGRKISHLTNLLSMSVDEREAELQAEKQRFEYRISKAVYSELFDLYHSYVLWTIKNYPEGHSVQSNLFNLLEAVCRRFSEDKDLKEDERYFQLWMRYIKFAENPQEIFVTLDADRIGTTFAARYEEEARYFEKNNKIYLADRAYQKGLKIQTHPPGALERSYLIFQERTAGLVSPPQAEIGGASTSASATLPKKERFSLFRDPDGSRSLLEETVGSHIPFYGPKNIRNKMNVVSDTAWGGLVIPQLSVSKKAVPKLKIKRDEFESSQSEDKVVEDLKLLVDKPTQTTSTALMGIDSKHETTSSTSACTYFYEKGSGQPETNFVVMADIKLLGLKAKNEISFEEHRIRTTLLNYKQPESIHPLTTSKPASEALSQIIDNKKRPHTESLALNHKQRSVYQASTDLPKKKPTGLIRFKSIHTTDLRKFKEFEALMDYPKETPSNIDESAKALIEKDSLLDEDDVFGAGLDNAGRISITDDDTTSFLSRTPSVKVLLTYPTARTAQALEEANEFYSHPLDSVPELEFLPYDDFDSAEGFPGF